MSSDYNSLMQRGSLSHHSTIIDSLEDRKKCIIKSKISRLQDYLIERPREELVRWEQEDRIRTESLRALENTRFLSSRMNLMHEAAVWCDHNPNQDLDEQSKKRKSKVKKTRIGGSRAQSSSVESLPLDNIQERWALGVRDVLASSETTLEKLTQFVFFKITSALTQPDPLHEEIWKEIKNEHKHGAFLILLTYVLPTVQQFVQSTSFAASARLFLQEQLMQINALLDDNQVSTGEERADFEKLLEKFQALLDDIGKQEARLYQLLEQLSRYQIVVGQWAIKLIG